MGSMVAEGPAATSQAPAPHSDPANFPQTPPTQYLSRTAAWACILAWGPFLPAPAPLLCYLSQ